MNRLVILFFAMLLPVLGSAAEFQRPATITKIAPFALNRPAQAASQGYTRVYTTPNNWGSSDCRTDAADISNEDDHILSVLLAAWMSGKTVVIHVDNTLKPLDSACQVTWITVE